MPLRTVLLRVMLWSLGIAAVAGVLTVLVHGGETAWRVVGTALTTAVATGLMLPASAMMDHKKSRSAGLVGVAAVIVEFLLALALIWELPRHLWGVHWEDEIAGTMLVLAAATIFAMVFLALVKKPYAVFASRVGLLLTLVTCGAWVLGIWELCVCSARSLQEPCRCQNIWFETGGATAVCGILIVLCLIGHGTADRRPWRWAGIVASGVAYAMWLINIWTGMESDLGTVIFTTLLSLAVVVVHANLSLTAPLEPHQRWVRNGTIVAAALTATFIDLIVIDEVLFRFGDSGDFLVRLAAASGILTGCGTMALAVLARLNRRIDYEPLSPELTHITVVCPRCGKRQSICLGDSVCVGCKLRISIRIEEPRCPQCGYLLYGLPSDRCPECGTVISPDTGTDRMLTT